MEQATELEYLIWFFQNAEFGPAHGDVMIGMEEEFREESGKEVPAEYAYE